MTPDLLFKILLDRRLRVIVLLVVLALLAHQVSLVFWHFYPETGDATATQRPAVVRNTAEAAPSTNYQQQAGQIARAFLFGKPAVQAATVAQAEEAPKTQLNYKLRGIYYSPEPRLSSAIIEVRPNDSQHYLLDDELADNITLAGIEPDHILISRYGKLERLDLEKPDPITTAQQSRAGASGSAQQTALLRSYKRRYTSNPMALATRFQAIPVQQDGKNIGFKLKPLRGESLLRKLDFEPDDIFTAVNGVSLRNPFEALDALKSLTTADRVQVTILRNGAEQTLDFQL